MLKISLDSTTSMCPICSINLNHQLTSVVKCVSALLCHQPSIINHDASTYPSPSSPISKNRASDHVFSGVFSPTVRPQSQPASTTDRRLLPAFGMRIKFDLCSECAIAVNNCRAKCASPVVNSRPWSRLKFFYR
jgi:hypothetical protein